MLVLSCLLGWVVAKIHSKLKRKNLLTTLIALAFFALYYMVCFRANELIEQLMLHLNEVGAAIRGSAYPLYLMGRMGAGDYLAVVLVLAVMAALCALTYLLLSRTFLSIATANNGGAKAVYKETTVRAAGVPAALLRKELGRFTASPNYMLNCGLGTVMLPILGVLLLVKSSDLLPVIYEMAGGEASGLLAAMLCAALCLVGSMNDMASSSISLEEEPVAGTVPAGDTVAGTACKAAGAGAGNGYPHGSHLCTDTIGRPPRPAAGPPADSAASGLCVAVGSLRPDHGPEAPQPGLDQ